MTRPLTALLALLAACVVPAAEDRDDVLPPVVDTCDDPAYGDGTCELVLDCDAPDIDCFRFFDSQDDVEGWFADFEVQLAAEQLRDPRVLVPSTDPRFTRMRDLLDRGWAAYHEHYPVADLSIERPALVLIDDPVVNAFVIPDLATDRSGFAVMVQTGVFDQGAPDDEMLGLVFHELEHAVRLHTIGDTRDRIRKFYVTRDPEPVGASEVDDPIARTHGEAWRALANEVGPYTDAALGGLPSGRTSLGTIFNLIVDAGATGDPAHCADPAAAYLALVAELGGGVSLLDGSLPPLGGVRDRVDAVLADLDQQCITGPDTGFVDLMAQVGGLTPKQFEQTLTPDDLALVDGTSFVAGVEAIILDRRRSMRDTEATFEADTGRPWSDLRYYSSEEAADDAPAPVLEAIGLAADGLGGFVLNALIDPDTAEVCSDLLDAGTTPPYGVDLTDEHHASCWRVDHVERAIGAGPANARRVSPAPARNPWEGLLPPRLSDRVVY